MLPTPERPDVGTFVGDQVESLSSLGLDLEVVHVPRLSVGARAYRGLGAVLFGRAAAFAPDVVHVMYGGVMAQRTVAAGLTTPVVVSFCGSDLLGIPVGSGVRRLRLHVGVRASRQAAMRAQAVIVKSAGLRAALPRGVDAGRVWTIPNGVDLKRFRPLDRRTARRTLGWPDDERTIVFPASPRRREKRFELALAAADTLAREVPGVRLRALEGVPHDAVPLWLNASDAVVLTSTHEGSPNAVKEALACCIPVVSVDVGDVRERVEGVPGCSIVTPDAQALAAALRLALEIDRNDAGRERVSALSLERVGKRIVEVYEAVVPTPRAAAGPRLSRL